MEAGQDLDHQPGSGVRPEKSTRDRLIRLAGQHADWVLGFQDETWWSRLALPALHSWAEADRPLRLVERAVVDDDPDPKAVACYGVQLRRAGSADHPDQPDEVWRRFVDGRPLSALTVEFLDWSCARLEQARVRVWALIWDNAPWHVSKAARTWIRAHNRQVTHQQAGHGVRLLVCYLPIKSPWLNPIEAQWARAKRVVVEAERLLTAQELADRVCAHFGCPHEPHLIQEKAS